MSASGDRIREMIKHRTSRLAEIKCGITNLNAHLVTFRAEQKRLEEEVEGLRADLKKIEPVKVVAL